MSRWAIKRFLVSTPFLEFKLWWYDFLNFIDRRWVFEKLWRSIKWGIFIFRSTWTFDSTTSVLFELISYKLKETEDCFNSEYCMIANASKYARQISVVRALIKRHNEDKYYQDEWDEHHRKYPSRLDQAEELTSDSGMKMYRVPSPSEEESEDFKQLWDKSVKAQQRDEEAIYRLIKKYSCRWWD